MKKREIKYLISVATGLTVLLLDLATKAWASGANYKPVKLIGDFLYFSKIQFNSGIAFGIQVPKFIQIFGSILILIILFFAAHEYIFRSRKHVFIKPALFGIIVGGAIGNLYDRIVQGYVVDFIALKPIPTFNVADIGITVGLTLLFIFILSDSKGNIIK